MEELSFKLDDFTGPLDLLLDLIAKHKYNILDLPIAELLKQYMDFINHVDKEDLDERSEFLEMAARLIYIKSAMLLPKYEDEPEELKSQLVGELMEYSICKLAAEDLSIRARDNVVFTRKPMDIKPDYEYKLTHSPYILVEALKNCGARAIRKAPAEPKRFIELVERRQVSVESRVIHILKRLYRNSTLEYKDIFSDQTDKPEMVAMFIAILELCKNGRIKISEDNTTVTFVGREKKKK